MRYDTIIVGAGSMGMAAGYYLAKKGKHVLLIDSFDPPHHHGSHHGETRIIRHAYGEGAQYVPLVLRAQELWNELEKQTDMKLFLQTGVLNIGEENAPFIQEVIQSAKKYNLPIETLNAKEIHAKFPGLNVPENLLGCLEVDSGVLFSENCILAYRQLAESLGATIKVNTEVTDIKLHENWVSVRTNGEAFEGDSLIVSAGAWSKKLLERVNVSVPLTTIRKTFSWFDTKNENYDASDFPAFTLQFENEMYYGFPNIEGAGLKIGRHDGGQEITMGESIAAFGTYTEDEADVFKVIDKFFPHIEKHKQGKTCIYTNTPDEDFVIDTLPNNPNVAIACGFSGHGYKFSSVVGEILSQLVSQESVSFDLTPFRLNRFSLQDK